MSAQRRQSGFTLIELMLGVLIVAALTALLAPSVRRSLNEQRLAAATRDFAALLREARIDTMTYGRAHLVWIDATSGNVRLLRGRNNSCSGGDWNNLNTQCTANLSGRDIGTECAELSFSDPDYVIALTTSLTLEEMVASASGGADTAQSSTRGVCYAPSGLTYLETTGTLTAPAFTTDNTVNGGLLYRITMNRLAASNQEVKTLPPRFVMVPLYGYAKVLL